MTFKLEGGRGGGGLRGHQTKGLKEREMYMLNNELQVLEEHKLKYPIANKIGVKNILYFY